MPHRVRLISLAIASILPLAACSNDQGDPAQEPTSEPDAATTISLAHPFPADSIPGRAAETFADLVEESGGELAVEVSAEAEAWVGDELTSQLADGDVDAILVTTAGTGLDPRLQLQSLPFLATSPQEAHELFYGTGLVAAYEADVFHEHGVQPVYQFEAGFRGLSASGKAVRLPEDLDGLSVRVFPAPWMIEAFESWGATPEDVPADKLKKALEKGDVDAQESGVRSFISSGLAEVQDTFTDLRHSYATYTLVMGDAAWKQLSGEEREILEQAAREASEASQEEVQAADDQAHESLGDEVELVVPTKEEYAAWRASVRDIYVRYQRAFGKKIIRSLSKRPGS
ncbi:TRAP transporter substrate-binding protein [Nocardioides pelophilus]|uniref:TRAP transporter substrate-binding protein n=1 Tax=Nocardioides pelophilus TaxID=2172019 RepID=UPI0016003AE1|nr:TRAP transporter substrate-binding protein [Nocardioides pelophilus]